MRTTLAAATLLLTPVFALAADLKAFSAAGEQDKVAKKITAAIDKHVTADWTARQITPAPQADDAEFCRRVYLDVIGRIPKVAEVREFLADTDATKRGKLVDKLLQKPGYSIHLASTLRAAWLPETVSDPFKIYFGQQYETWLQKKLSAGVGVDKIVRDTVTAKVAAGQRGQFFQADANDSYDSDRVALQAFFQAVDVKPETLGATTSRAFLGVKLECAQCHDHPFAPYTREQFWQFAAFFGEFTPLPPVGPNFVGPLSPQHDKNRLNIPGTSKQMTAVFMDGRLPDWVKDRTPRQELADWMTAADNPYFARNLVNRLWHQYFGVGLVDPVDEPGDANPPSHPELLAELSVRFVEGGYDPKTMIRGMALSRAYQLTSRLTHPSQGETRRFARMPMKGLSGHQIYDSFVAATGVRNPNSRAEGFYYEPNQTPGRVLFRTLFPSSAKPTETQTSILQALAVMNGKLTTDQTSLDRSEVLAAVLDSPFLDTPAKIDTLFLAALTREPTSEEREKLASYVTRGGPSGDSKQALADVFWVLLNSTEFLFNH